MCFSSLKVEATPGPARAQVQPRHHGFICAERLNYLNKEFFPVAVRLLTGRGRQTS